MTQASSSDDTARIEGYHIISKIGASAGAVTYRARRDSDGVELAIKLLYTDYTRLADVAELKHAYGALKDLSSDAVIKVHGIEEHADGLLLVTEYFPSTPLSSLLGATHRLDISAFLNAAIAMASGLAAIHQHGLVHGDIRPQNILLGDGGGGLKLAGFGVDSVVTREKEEIYSHRVLADVLPYTSPEQTGRMNRSVDYRTDVYSLGVVFYEMLTGRRPFEAQDPLELMHAHLALKPIAPRELNPEIPCALSAITMKLLSKGAEDRYQSADGLRSALEECRRRWVTLGEIGPFKPCQYDRHDLFQLHQKLYGREEDVRTLIDTFNNVLQSRRAIVLVSGYSGIGKSSLVQEILKPLAREKGYYISGKYDQYHRDTPYSAVVEAFDALIKQLLSESEERITTWREAIADALGGNAQVICDVLPSLKHVIGEQPAVPALGPVEAQHRFIHYFRRFVSVFARPAHPLALFLDDLQWVDSASLRLITTLLADGMESLFFCGAYRDNEVGTSHPLMVALGELQKSDLEVVNIVLEPLRLTHLLDLIDDSLQTRNESALAAVVLKKTGGNPFFVKQFLKHLHEARLLVFQPLTGWTWDLPRIERLEYTENVLSLMVATIRRLPQATQEVLRLAAAIGNRFDLEVLNTVSASSPDETYARLNRALSEGLIVSGEQYRFAHDKIQEAAYSLIPEGNRPAFHYRIGTLLLGRLDPDKGHNLFDIVNHLNRAGDLICSPQERAQSASLNLKAAERAEDSTAFAAALTYLEHGISMLPDDTWISNYGTTFTYHTKLGLMKSLCGRHDEALATLRSCFDHARGRLHQTEVRRLKMNVEILKNDLPAALEEGLAAIGAYGIHLEPYPDDSALFAELDRSMAMLGSRPIASLVDLPPLDDPEIAALQDVLQEMFAPTYQLGTNNFGITVMKMLQNSLVHGVSKNSIYAYVNFGTFLCAKGDIQRGTEFGRAALRLNELRPDKKSEAMLWNMWGAWIQHWTERYSTSKGTLLQGIHAGMETGQYIWSFYNVCNVMLNDLLSGRHLQEIVDESNSHLALCKLDKFNTITWMVGATAQLCEELRTPEDASSPPRSSWVDMDAITAEARRINNRASLYFSNIFAVIRSVFSGAYEEAARVWSQTDPQTLGMLGAYQGTPGYYFYGALALSQACGSAPPELQETYSASLSECARKLELWAAIGPRNFRHRSLIVRAELARLAQSEDAGRLFDLGIAAARDSQFVHDGALANELCARHYLSLGRTFLARAYMTEAHSLYARWGAARAMKRLEKDFPHVLQSSALRRPSAVAREREHVADSSDVRQQDRLVPAPSFPFDASHPELDFVSVLKASQAVSSELMLDRLVETLLSIAVEHAGAERGLLICPHDAGYDVEAEIVAGRDRVELKRRKAPITPSDLPVTILQYVARTRETVILDDATAANLFSNDIYVRRRRPRSVLCLPLVKQGTLAGVLYLENSLAPRVFTAGRTATLELLACQSAISLENARLYAQLQQENSERRRAEIALREREARIRRLMDSNIIGIAFWDLGGRITDANEAFLNIVGCTRQDLVGGLDWRAMTPPESSSVDERAIERMLTTGQCPPYEKVYVRKDGRHVPVLLGTARFEGTEDEGVAFCLDLTEQKQAEERQRLLLNELNHRVKNTLAIVHAIASQTLRTADSPKAFVDAFGSRLMSLSLTYNLLNETSWEGASLDDIARAELEPHAHGRFSVTGENVRLRPQVAVILGMAFHELATNAIKYGALSLPSGHVFVSWNRRADESSNLVHLEWREVGGPHVHAPERKGFGSRLLERELGRQLASDVCLEFMPDGVRCVMDLPMDGVSSP